MEKFELQEAQYKEPYHHYVSIGGRSLHKLLPWGLEYRAYISRVVEIAKSVNPIKIADVGCGDGKVLLEVARTLPKSAIAEGYDLAKNAIQFARAYSSADQNVLFFDTDFNESKKEYDLILCIETLEHISDQDTPGFLETLRSHLSKDGLLIVTVPSVNLPLNPKHYRHYDEEVLKKSVNGLFEIQHTEYVYANTLGSRLIRFFLVNRFFVLQFAPLRQFLFSLHDRRYRSATRVTGHHLLATLKRI